MSRDVKTLLSELSRNTIGVDEATRELLSGTVSDLGFSKVDMEREERNGYPEVIYGEGKTADQIVKTISSLMERGQNILCTRISADQYTEIESALPGGTYHPAARCLTYVTKEEPLTDSYIAIVTAGTSDMPVAEEAAVTAELYGNRVVRIYDVGVAGLQRLLMHIDVIRKAKVIIVIAGMEGALVSVVGGLVARPVIAVPTSVGYGTSFFGVTALLGMLNSCASGVTVVNIDNGFGAAYSASMINHLGERS